MSAALSISTSEHWRLSPVLFMWTNMKQLFNISTDPSMPPSPAATRPWSGRHMAKRWTTSLSHAKANVERLE